jgi:hypothetical protein
MTDHGRGLPSELQIVLRAVAAELERLAEQDVDPTDQLPAWLLDALPQPDGRTWLCHARERWEPIVRQLRSEAGVSR